MNINYIEWAKDDLGHLPEQMYEASDSYVFLLYSCNRYKMHEQ